MYFLTRTLGRIAWEETLSNTHYKKPSGRLLVMASLCIGLHAENTKRLENTTCIHEHDLRGKVFGIHRSSALRVTNYTPSAHAYLPTYLLKHMLMFMYNKNTHSHSLNSIHVLTRTSGAMHSTDGIHCNMQQGGII